MNDVQKLFRIMFLTLELPLAMLAKQALLESGDSGQIWIFSGSLKRYQGFPSLLMRPVFLGLVGVCRLLAGSTEPVV